MAGTDKKIQGFTAFNAGEYSSDLAGRTDLESFGSSTRYTSNMLTQVSGGLKKFYGSRHIVEKSTGTEDLIMIPFINKYEPMAFVVYGRTDEEQTGLKVGLIYGDNYKDLAIELPLTVKPRELRWQQVNDRLILCHKSVQPFSIDFYGVDGNGDYIFNTNNIAFKEVPYFPIGTTDDYAGELQASGLSGDVTLTIPSGSSNIRTYLPSVLLTQSTYMRSTQYTGTPNFDNPVFNNSTFSLYRVRGGVDTQLVSGVVNSPYWRNERYGNTWKYFVEDKVNRERVLNVIKTICPNAYIDDTMIVLFDLPNHQDGDKYYTVLSVGRVYKSADSATIFQAATYTSEQYQPTPTTTGSINAESLIGRKIKLFFNEDTVISPWWQSKSVTTGDYAYSNGHWYKALTTGTCGNVQPSHTYGDRSDGGVVWRYVHSGSKTATIMSVPDSQSIKIFVANGELPKNTGNIYKNYAWSIWGKDDVHPSDIYMVSNRLGFVCNTTNYGAWNAMSITDDYFNFDTEEYGEQLDTSAIVGLIGNTEGSAINWVLARTRLYMGGYSGEYYVNPGGTGRRAAVYTPTATIIENISNMGGRDVIPLKYKELNMFVGGTGKELYTISYDYTTDDYTPKMLGYLTQHIMERGIKRINALNNLDRNIYLLHDTNSMSLFNYAAEQKVMGFTELDFGDKVIDFVTTYSNDVIAGYVATERNQKSATASQTRGTTLTDIVVDVEKFSKMISTDGSYGFEYGVSEWYHDSEEVDLEDYGITFVGTPHATDEITVEYIAQKITFERLSTIEPNYMWDEILQGDGTLAEFAPVPHFANRTVWIKYGDDFGQFVKCDLDENGDVSHNIVDGVVLPLSKHFKVGLPMISELHTQPAFGQKLEGHQQNGLSVYIRLNKSGAFSYGSSADFSKYFRYENWHLQQGYDEEHRLYTGDIKLDIPLGYTEAQNQGEGKYPNTSGVGINIKSDTPEPLNILSMQEIYV